MEGENLALRALREFRFATDWEAPPLRLTITKRIPIAAGMAGGSGNAAAALRLASEASGFPIPPDLPMRLGADVPVMLAGVRSLVTGAGEHVEPLTAGTPSLVILPVDAQLGAGEVYAAFDRLCTPRTDEELAEIAAKFRTGVGQQLNDLERPARALCPAIEPAIEALHAVERAPPDGHRLRPDGVRVQPGAAGGRRAPARRGPRARSGGMKFTWLAAAAVLAGWLIARRDKQKRWFQIAELVVIAAFVLIGVGVIQLPNFEQVLEDAGKALGKWTYLAVGVLAFLETGAFLGFIAPGETAVIVGGLVAGQGQISLLALIAIVWVCCILGDLTSYELGRRKGRGWLLRHGGRLKITDERLDQVEKLLDRRGAAMIIIGRFLGFVRPLMPFIAGASRMPRRRFLPYDVLAAGAWAITFCTLGFVFWRSIDQLTTYVSRGLFAFGTLIVLIGGIVALIHLRRSPEARRRVREWIDARDDRPGWRIVAKLSRPVWHMVLKPTAAVADFAARFGQDRITPGNLGLELTTLLALIAVGTFSFFLLGDIVMLPGEPRIDRWAFRIADELRSAMLVDVAKVVTHIGSSPVTGARGGGHRPVGGAQAAPDRGGRARRRLAAPVRRHAPRQGALRPPASVRRAGGDDERRLPVGPLGVCGRARRLRPRAGPRRRRLGRARGRGHGRARPRRDRRRHPRLPARALPDGRARRDRAGRRRVVADRRARACRLAHSAQWGGHVMSDDDKTYLIAGAAAAISLIAWLALVVVPAWRSYWRVRDRLVATILSLYVLAAFVLAGAGVGAVALWYFSDRVSI